MKTIAKAIPHTGIILAGMLIVLVIVDQFNPAMGFLQNDGAKAVMLLLGIASIAGAIMLIALQRRIERTDDRL